jgi:hypothetical protein
VTTPPPHYPDASIYGGVPAAGERKARQATEPLRELAALVLLGGNAVFLLIAVLSLFFTFDHWAIGFGARADATFGDFAGLIAIGFPVIAVLLATHVPPMLGRARLITLVALVEYAVSGFFGLIAFIGRFASRLDSAPILGQSGLRRAFEGLFAGMVWLGLLAFAAYVVYRVWAIVFYVPKPRYAYPPTYGQPYPGQPAYSQPPQPYQTGYAQPAYQSPYALPAGSPVPVSSPATVGSPVAMGSPYVMGSPVAPSTGSPPIPSALSFPTSGAGGWPSVPAPPMPAPPRAPGSPVQPSNAFPAFQPVTPAHPPAGDSEPTRRLTLPPPEPDSSYDPPTQQIG